MLGMKALLVEDEQRIASFVCSGLREQGILVDHCEDGNLGYDYALSRQYDIILLDIMVPGRDGLAILKALRRDGRDTPVILLTARNELDDRLEGLNLGADDYLAKPFELAELEARVKALLRRSAGNESLVYECGALRFDTVSRMFSYFGENLQLTPREHAVLEALITKGGKPVAKEKLFDQVFSLADDANLDAIELYIHRVRKKLDRKEPGAAAITTLRGIGYLLQPAEAKA